MSTTGFDAGYDSKGKDAHWVEKASGWGVKIVKRPGRRVWVPEEGEPPYPKASSC